MEIIIKEPTQSEFKKFINEIEDSGMPPEQTNILDLIKNSKNVIGAFKGKNMIGAISFSKSKNIPNATSIDEILVHPSHREMSVGKNLIKNISNKVKTDFLVTNPYTYEAEEFFKKLGFIEDQEIDQNDPNTYVLKIK